MLQIMVWGIAMVVFFLGLVFMRLDHLVKGSSGNFGIAVFLFALVCSIALVALANYQAQNVNEAMSPLLQFGTTWQ